MPQALIAMLLLLTTPVGVGARVHAMSVPPAQGQQLGFDQRLRRGLLALESGRAEAAIPDLQAAVDERPESVEARYHLGRALMTAGRPQEAVPHLEAALSSAPEPGPIHFLLAQVLLQLEDLGRAGEELAAAAAARPGYAPTFYYRAELCYRLGNVEEARQGFETVAEATPGWNLPRVRLGMIALDEDDAEGAIEYFNAAAQLNENNPPIWMRLASAYVAAGQTEEAVDAYRKAVEVGPDFLPAHMALVGQLNAQRDYDGMRAALDAMLAVAPGHPLGHYQLASLLSTQGENEEALAAVDVALAGFDGQAAAAGVTEQDRQTYGTLSRGLRAQLLMKLGRDEEAVAEARRVVESAPWYPDAHFVLGTLQMRQRDPAGRERLQRFKELSDAREHREQADARLRGGDLERAAAEYEQALAADPDDSGSLLGMAEVLRRSGDPDGALQMLDRVSPTGAQSVIWYRERILSLEAAGRGADVTPVWQESRALGLELGPEVWRITRRGIPGCG